MEKMSASLLTFPFGLGGHLRSSPPWGFAGGHEGTSDARRNAQRSRCRTGGNATALGLGGETSPENERKSEEFSHLGWC